MDKSDFFIVNEIPETLIDAIRFFADPMVSLRFFIWMRWPEGVRCPHCDYTDYSIILSRSQLRCKRDKCRRQFSPKVGTVFEDSRLSLDKWLIGMWMLCNCKNGISSYEISRGLGITQKSAWFLLHRLRLALKNRSLAKAKGTVEADEAFIGGSEKNKHNSKKLHAGTGPVGKEIVLGLLERGEYYVDKHGERKRRPSTIRTKVIRDRKRETLHAEVKAHVDEGSELMTDAAQGYKGLDETHKHQFVDHMVRYVEGQVHTNGLENFWSLTKRMLKGTYVSVDPAHLMAYLDEQTFRFNERAMTDSGRFLMALSQISGRHLTYQDLIGNPQGESSPDPRRGGLRAD